MTSPTVDAPAAPGSPSRPVRRPPARSARPLHLRRGYLAPDQHFDLQRLTEGHHFYDSPDNRGQASDPGLDQLYQPQRRAERTRPLPDALDTGQGASLATAQD